MKRISRERKAALATDNSRCNEGQGPDTGGVQRKRATFF